jgi:FkbM family methyltransferase
MNNYKNIIKNIFKLMGFDIKNHPDNCLKSKKNFMKYGGFNVVIDVGASEGQYIDEIRNILNFQERIISFEPIISSFTKLKKKNQDDHRWIGFNYGLGHANESAIINISKHKPSSSFLDFNQSYLSNHKNFEYIEKQQTEIKTLDSIYEQLLIKQTDNVLLKIDAQGFENNIIKGALNNISKFNGLHLELSVSEIYKGEKSFYEIIDFLDSLNFRVFNLEPYYYSPNSYELLQIEAYFLNKKIITCD